MIYIILFAVVSIIIISILSIVRGSKHRFIKSIVLAVSVLFLLIFIGVDIVSTRRSESSVVKCEFIDIDRSRYTYIVTFREVNSNEIFDVPVVDLDLPRVGDYEDFYRYDWANFHWYVPIQDVFNTGDMYSSLVSSSLNGVKIFREEER